MKPLADQLGVDLTLCDAADQLFGTRLGETLNELLIKGLMDFFDEGQSIWRMPGRRQGLFRGWANIARRNRRLRMRGLDVGTLLLEAEGPEAMIDLVMTRLGVPEPRWMDYFTVELARLHGWAGFVRWRAQAPNYYWQQRNPADLVDYLAIRLVLALALLDDAGRRLRRDLRWPALMAFATEHPRECLLRRELNAGTVLPEFAHRIEVVLDGADGGAIDALYLEYERQKIAREACTRAGRVRVMAERAGIGHDALLARDDDSLHQVIDGIYAAKAREGMLWTRALELIANLQDELVVRAVDRVFSVRRESLAGSMIGELRETALGERRGRTAFARQFEVDAAAEAVFIRTLQVEYRINPDQARIQLEHLAKIGFRHQRQAQLVANGLRGIGLTEGFGRTVLVVGHGSTSENNPYESALDCGACGGDQGLVNARIFAAMANRREVRALLAEQGIRIPEDTRFTPALHDTTTDEIELFDLDQLPPGALTRVTRIQEDLTAAGRLCAAERCAELGETGIDGPAAAARRVKRHALDWTQVRPEWGLSKNASFIIGRRAVTRGVDLGGRAFMHSYDHRLDPGGRLLEGILSGPLVVAQWINMEHFFSVVDNEAFGSGSKVYHNVVGRFGVVTGNLSDLRTGLPAQTMLRADRPYHQPMRLITLVEAPLTLVESLLAKLYKPRELVQNGWIRLVVLDPDTGQAQVYEPRRGDRSGGGWEARRVRLP